MESQFRNKQTSQYLCLFRNHLDRNKTKKILAGTTQYTCQYNIEITNCLPYRNSFHLFTEKMKASFK